MALPGGLPQLRPALRHRLAVRHARSRRRRRPTPKGLGEDDSIARLLDEAEDIINAAGPEILADLEKEKRKGAAGQGPALAGRGKD